jgi:hypothetical protein
MPRKLLLALPAVAIALTAACGSWEAPDPPPPEPEQVSVVDPAQECPPPGITLRRDAGC